MQNRIDDFLWDGLGWVGTRCVSFNPRNSVNEEALTPQRGGVGFNVEFYGNLVILVTLRRSEYDSGPDDEIMRGGMASRPDEELLVLLRSEVDGGCDADNPLWVYEYIIVCMDVTAH